MYILYEGTVAIILSPHTRRDAVRNWWLGIWSGHAYLQKFVQNGMKVLKAEDKATLETRWPFTLKVTASSSATLLEIPLQMFQAIS